MQNRISGAYWDGEAKSSYEFTEIMRVYGSFTVYHFSLIGFALVNNCVDKRSSFTKYRIMRECTFSAIHQNCVNQALDDLEKQGYFLTEDVKLGRHPGKRYWLSNSGVVIGNSFLRTIQDLRKCAVPNTL